ncbi:efflux RND transporter periplasmic adaptor subunit [Rhizobium lentis]|uniref:Efflux RND transporter periplasmic adaptor subunit n=1 Tax=Rhizobium lentis TaxID=1138194 RepID=A0A9Q3QY26_9HYPH|nr:efflux RND transporter periplasmic adaptor subunit [Rhizobium lentis]MBX5025474.1 efflux RND transporter periplasmic adaptor subunit [Rhizobium lentis]MBX5039103.1 efflux RND transporter periplasmic adaptor subunit [Rhizobium lentis]MBX5056444.1 efflux RND transporter periplasmic adaptor subunit [Rhizobium lentis]MBX5069957.1 efflux RND transporter periplasmic adaptor subunit [Rhizobium lentis]MBX5111359.1 efflux RND transporter periplasmic adaptor subunit [Rhizobium lentis]
MVFSMIRRYRMASLSLLGCGVFALAGLSPDVTAQQSAKGQDPEVSVQRLQRRDVTLTRELPGRTSAQLVSEVRPRVTGTIRRRVFEEGSVVKAGDVLYELDRTSFEATYRNAQAALQRAESAIPSSRARFDRYQRLRVSNVVSQQDLDEARTQLLQAEADVAAANAALETARIELGYTTIVAPIGGRVDASNVTQGALVTQDQAQPLTVIRQHDIVNVDLVRSSSSLLTLNKALASNQIRTNGEFVTVELKLEDGSRYPHPGKLQFSGSAVSQSTGMVSLRAVFPNPNGILMPGMYVRALIEEGFVQGSFLVPQRAVSRNPRGQATAKFVTDDMKVEERVLTVDRTIGNSWLVTDGVSDGDRVIVEGFQRAGVGQQVRTKVVVVEDETGDVRNVAEASASPGEPKSDTQAFAGSLPASLR